MSVTPTPPPRRLPAAARREQLLDVTRDLVGDVGFHGVSIEAVARRAGVTRPVVYTHFGDLETLLTAMLDRETARAQEQLAAVLPRALATTDRREALLAAAEGYLDTVRADPVTWRMALLPPEGAPPMLRDRVAAGRAAVIALLAAFVGSGLPPGRESPDAELTARLLSAVADEMARLHLTDRVRYDRERLLAHARWLVAQIEL